MRIELRPSTNSEEFSMANNGKFQPGQSGNPATQFRPGNRYRWRQGQSGNPAGVARNRLQFNESFYEALLSHRSADEVANLLADALRDREPWAIQIVARLQRFARGRINVECVRRNRRAVKLANDPSAAAAQVADAGEDSKQTDSPTTVAVNTSTRPNDTEDESSRRVSLKQRYEEFCLAKIRYHLRTLPQAVRAQMFDEARSAIRRALPQLRRSDLDEMAQQEVVSRVRARLHLPSMEEFAMRDA